MQPVYRNIRAVNAQGLSSKDRREVVSFHNIHPYDDFLLVHDPLQLHVSDNMFASGSTLKTLAH